MLTKPNLKPPQPGTKPDGHITMNFKQNHHLIVDINKIYQGDPKTSTAVSFGLIQTNCRCIFQASSTFRDLYIRREVRPSNETNNFPPPNTIAQPKAVSDNCTHSYLT